MTNSLAAVLDDTSQSTVWIDAWDYCRNLFLNGQALDWNNRQSIDEFVRKSDSLIHSQVFCVPLAPFLQHAITSIAGLKDSMGQKSRTGYALKTLLRDEELRRQIQQALSVISEAISNKPMVLALPAPRYCIQWAYEAAHGRSPETVTVDHADSASVYLSDFVTSLGQTGLAGLLIQEQCGDAASWAQELEIYVPLRNVTQHQQWQLGLRLPFAASADTDVASFDFAISKGELGGAWLKDDYWTAAAAAPDKDLIYGVIPADAEPETVLVQRKALGAY